MTDMIDIRVGSVAEFMQEIAFISSDYPAPLWYRGQRDASWHVQAALWREEENRRRPYTPADERNFTHRFRTRAAMRYPNERLDYDDHSAWLSLMQHYGLPTRLLDWSRSPLVAAYFAVEAYFNVDMPARDAAIFVLSPHQLNRDHAYIEFTPAINSRVCDDWIKPAFLDQDRERNPPRDLGNDGPIAVMATELDLRMFVQQGCFTIHKPHTMPLDSPEVSGLRWRFVVPARHVHDFARQMDVLGFRGGDLFPDLQNLAGELIRSHPAGSIRPMKF